MPDKYRMTPAERDLLIRTVIGEADDQPEDGQAAVAHVVMNRLRGGQHGKTVPEVVLARGQFEPWQTRARELVGIDPQSPRYQRVAGTVDRVINGEHDDPTGGATHFLDEKIVRRRRGGSLPSWASGDGLKIGDHTFYRPGGALPYADEGGATTVAGPAGKRTDGQRLAQAAAPDDIAETLRQLGVRPPGAAAAPAASAAIPDDVAETLRQAGVSMDRSQPIPKPEVPAAPPGRLGPELQRQAEQEAGRLGPVSTVASGMPIAGAIPPVAAAAVQSAFPGPGTAPGDDFMQRFAGNNQVMQEAQRLYNLRHPRQAFAGNLLGSTAMTAAGALSWPGRLALGLEGPSIASRVYTGTAGNASINSLDALMRGEDVVPAAAIGAGTGFAAPLIGSGVSNAVNTLGRLAPGPGMLRGTNMVARGWLRDALEGETPASIAAGRQRAGPSGMAMDVNTGMTDIAGGLADTPGPQKAVVREAIRQRGLGQRGRIDDALTNAGMPHIDIEGLRNRTIEERARAADPLYEQWRTMEVHPTDKLKALIPRLEDVGAFEEAKFFADASGQPLTKAFFTGGNSKEFPTTRTWDLVKRGLDSLIEGNYGAGKNARARELINLKREMIEEIERTPAGHIWRQARHEFASRSALLDQIEAGRDTFLGGRSGLSVDELREELRGLGAPEIRARMQGLRAAADQVMGDTLRGDTTLRNKMLAPNNQEKMRLLLGDQRANRLIQSMEQEQFLSQQRDNIAGGSQTTPKKERVNALMPPPPAARHFSLTEPATWVPQSALPEGVAAAWRGQRYAAARNQLGNLVTTPEGPELDRLLRDIGREGHRLSVVRRGADATGNALSALIAGPGAATARRELYPR